MQPLRRIDSVKLIEEAAVVVAAEKGALWVATSGRTPLGSVAVTWMWPMGREPRDLALVEDAIREETGLLVHVRREARERPTAVYLPRRAWIDAEACIRNGVTLRMVSGIVSYNGSTGRTYTPWTRTMVMAPAVGDEIHTRLAAFAGTDYHDLKATVTIPAGEPRYMGHEPVDTLRERYVRLLIRGLEHPVDRLTMHIDDIHMRPPRLDSIEMENIVAAVVVLTESEGPLPQREVAARMSLICDRLQVNGNDSPRVIVRYLNRLFERRDMTSRWSRRTCNHYSAVRDIMRVMEAWEVGDRVAAKAAELREKRT